MLSHRPRPRAAPQSEAAVRTLGPSPSPTRGPARDRRCRPEGVALLKPLLALLAVLCTTGCLLGALAALKRWRRRAHLANAAVLCLCAAGSTLALAINPDSGAHAPGILLLLTLWALALACAAAARHDARWAWFWPAWLLSATSAAVLLYLWLVFRIF